MYAGALAPFVTSEDLVMAYSGSGNSSNVVKALEVANEAGSKTFAMTKGNVGKCKELATVCLVVPGTSRFPGQTVKNDNKFHFKDAVFYVNSILVGLLKEKIHYQSKLLKILGMVKRCKNLEKCIVVVSTGKIQHVNNVYFLPQA